MRLAIACLWCAALLACDERAVTPAPAPAAPSDARTSPETTRPQRPGEPPAASGRGDRHARASARRAPTVKRVAGTISRANGRLVVIRRPGAPEVTLRIAPGTSVTVNGQPARADALPPGADVRAAYETGSGGRPTALTLEVSSPAPPPRSAPTDVPGPPRGPEPVTVGD
jgi:hypothetical protein